MSVGITNVDIGPIKGTVSHLVQDGLLVGDFMKALGVQYQYDLAYSIESVPQKAGQKFSFTRDELLAAIQDPVAGTLSGLDSGITVDNTTGAEQWDIEMQSYPGGKDTHYDDNKIAFANLYLRHVKQLGEQAGRTNDLQCRRRLSFAAFGGRTHATTAETAGATALPVANFNGFDVKHSAAGVSAAVSASNPLVITVDGTTNACWGYTSASRTDASDMVSATMTLGTSTTWAIGDVVIASTAPKTIRPNSRTSSYTLTSSDTLTMDMIHDGVTSLREAGTPAWDDQGHYLFMGSWQHENALKKDSDFTLYYEGREDTDVFRKGRIVEAGGVLFSFGNQNPRSTTWGANSLTVNRGFLVGGDAAMKCQWDQDGADGEVLVNADNHFMYRDPATGVELVGRYPIDRLGKIMSTSWELQFGVDVTTDVLSGLGDVPNAVYKRIIGYETV